MGTELELKLAASPSTLRRAMQAPWLKKAALEKPKRERVISIYFDTSDLALRKHDVSLRVRKGNSFNLQTIKTMDASVSRGEWETEIKGDRPMLERAKDTALASLLSDEIERELHPVFETSVERVVVPLRVGDSEIELAFDRGRIITPHDDDGISEIEIELKRGRIQDLASLARRLAKVFPVDFGPHAKSERGYALLEGTRHRAVSARPVAIAPKMTAADAFAVIGFECLRHVASNIAAVRQGDPEGVHQMRIGLRRLRAALSLFKDMVSGPEVRVRKAELKWLTDQLGSARDYDVLLSEGVTPLLKHHHDRPELRVLEKYLESHRDRGFAKAKAAVESDRCRRLLLDTAFWLFDGGWRTDRDDLVIALRKRRIELFVKDEIKRRSRRVAKRLRKVDTLSPKRRHKLRISIKKIRYACEFFDGFIKQQNGRKVARKFDRALKELQNTLGKLNDVAVHVKLASDMAKSGKASQKAFGMGYLLGHEAAHSTRLLHDTAKAGRRFRKVAIY